MTFDSTPRNNLNSSSIAPYISIIVSTYNGQKYLSNTLNSLLVQSIANFEYEILVVDNNSTDNTASIIREYIVNSTGSIRYLHEATPGLLSARHTGAREAKGSILVYTDDDIIASPYWLEAIRNCFCDPEVALAGGKIVPSFECMPPEWINDFWTKDEHGTWMMHLSLLDLGDHTKEIPANYVFGCNYAIRKNTLYECGGFNPDGMPQELVRYRGDGEYGLAIKISAKRYRSVYIPEAIIEHLIPEDRMTPEYFCRRAFNQGVSDSYTEIRRQGKACMLSPEEQEHLTDKQRLHEQLLAKAPQIRIDPIRKIGSMVRNSYSYGRLFHRNEVLQDSKLLEYVLTPSYLFAFPIKVKNSLSTIEQPSPSRNIPSSPATPTQSILEQRAKAYFEGGLQKYRECLFAEAIAEFDEAMYLKPDLQDLHYYRCMSLLSVGRVSEAKLVTTHGPLRNEPSQEYIRSIVPLIKRCQALEQILSIPTRLTLCERMLLCSLARKISDHGVIVEIGSFLGASSCFLAEGSKEKRATVYCIDTWMNDAMSQAKSDTFREFSTNCSMYGKRIVPLRGFSDDVAKGFFHPIDLLFIDGDHSYEGCNRDIKAWLPKVRNGAVVVFHDYGWAEGVQRAVTEAIKPFELAPGAVKDSIYWTRIWNPAVSRAQLRVGGA